MLALPLLLLAACGEALDEAPGGDSGAPAADSGPAGGPDGRPGGGEGPALSPEITRADAWCQEYTTGTPYWVWIVEAEAEDPQGNQTLLPYGSPGAIYEGDALIGELALTCSDEGYCFASWQEEGAPLCATVDRYRIELQVADRELNLSEPVTVTPWRAEE